MKIIVKLTPTPLGLTKYLTRRPPIYDRKRDIFVVKLADTFDNFHIVKEVNGYAGPAIAALKVIRLALFNAVPDIYPLAQVDALSDPELDQATDHIQDAIDNLRKAIEILDPAYEKSIADENLMRLLIK